ncbi:putative aspartyl protease [Variovorax sp. SG517]|uniref:hypothetical protein n=1 Tax=Variovorax sp. SG517 TaxID=2587117 RepID=UPI00159DBCDB|nr:hypothetical protein [Variovorax sp. SG517]NVM87648.1 putative aspartyl protease [Variovorax sp. SG517]
MTVLTDLKALLIYILSAFVLVLGLATWHYRALARTSSLALQVQNAAVVATNAAAQQLLEQRTKERDAKQAELNKRAEAQEKTDEKAVTQISADDQRQRSAPVVVRVLDCTRDAGRSGGGAAGPTAARADPGTADTGAASGVLPAAGARRLADALTEIEKTSAAYSSCRADAYSVRGQAPPAE